MHRLVLVVYLALVISVVAVAVDSRKHPDSTADGQPLQELPNRNTPEPDATAEPAEHESVAHLVDGRDAGRLNAVPSETAE